MTWLLLYIIVCVPFGALNAHLSDRWVDWNNGKRIRHGLNGLVHLSAAVGAWFIYEQWQAPVLILFIARLFFDSSMNLYRNPPRGLGYVPINPKSLIDKAEKWLFRGNGIVPKIVYAFIIVVLLTI